MKTRKQGMFYQERRVLDCPVVPDDAEKDWWLAADIQREIRKRYGRYVSLTAIGKVAKEYEMAKQTSYGFKLYHRDLVDIIGGRKNG